MRSTQHYNISILGHNIYCMNMASYPSSILKEKHQVSYGQPDLDMIPSKIVSYQPDPSLLVTPEKSVSMITKLSQTKPKTIEESCRINPDPTLFVTPEKTNLEHNLCSCDPEPEIQVSPSKNKNKVRFILPSNEVTDNKNRHGNAQYFSDCDNGGLHSSINHEQSPTTTDMDSSNTNSTGTESDFGVQAALYTQRNPLQNISINNTSSFEYSSLSGGNESSSMVSSSDPFSSDVSQQTNMFKLHDNKGKALSVVPATSLLSNIDTAKKMPLRKPERSEFAAGKKPGLVQAKVNALTNPKKCVVSNKTYTTNSKKLESKTTYLKKKSGLKKHDHAVTYSSGEADVVENDLKLTKYHTSLVYGQQLQILKEEQFDPVQAVTVKVAEDADLKSHLKKTASSATNIDPEVQIYSNLVSLEVPMQEVAAMHEWKPVKRPAYLPKRESDGPCIMDFVPANLVQEICIVDSKFFTPPSPARDLSSIDSVMSIYEHSLCWDEFTCS